MSAPPDRLGIDVVADWSFARGQVRLGRLTAQRTRAAETFAFEYDEEWLQNPHAPPAPLDPDLVPFAGRQYPKSGLPNFGMFSDASPDRWGRQLMDSRFARGKRDGTIAADARLWELDYLTGVQDFTRLGALRVRLDDRSPFLDHRASEAAPPLVRLRELEAAARIIETAEDDDPQGALDAAIRLLLIPGGSLGGARPKAIVESPDHRLWIAKFPSASDRVDVGAWECVVARLALESGLRVAEFSAQRFGSHGHTYLVERFDRIGTASRKHFASAMTLTGHHDGDGASTGVSYLEIAEVLIDHGASTNEDLVELWSRIVFNVLVSNTDDHLRNHGFLLEAGGWRLSPAYDMNPVRNASGLSLNIDETDNALDLELVLAVAPYFRIRVAAARAIVDRQRAVVRRWRDHATSLGIPSRERTSMESAFRLADSS